MMPPIPEPAQFAPQMITEDAYTRTQMIAYGRAVAEACVAIAAKQGSAFAAHAIRDAAKEIGKSQTTCEPPQSP